MKIKSLIIACGFIACFAACNNQEQTFPDYAYTTGYFPYQYPVRTLLLGNDILYDNSNDNAHKFVVSVTMGGVYENNKTRTFTFKIDNSLCQGVEFRASGKPIKPLPANYFSLSSPDKIVIEPGNVNGGLTVQLTDAFFNDPEAIDRTYVLPLRIVSVEGLDSVLRGSSTLPNPDVRRAGDWNIIPKDFTMFAVKFRNPFDGTFLHRGRAEITGDAATTVVYRKPYVENDDLRTVATTGKNQVTLTAPLRIPGKSGTVTLKLNFAGDSSGEVACSITGAAEYDSQSYPITGSGKFAEGKESWGGKQRDALYLTYSMSNQAENLAFAANDTLVLRDRNMAIETYELTFSNQ